MALRAIRIKENIKRIVKMATVSVFYYREIGLFDAKVMLKIVFALRGIYAYNKHTI